MRHFALLTMSQHEVQEESYLPEPYAAMSWPTATRTLTSHAADEGVDRLPDLAWGVFLNEVGPPNGDLFLVPPPPAKLALGAREDHPRLGVDEELRYAALCVFHEATPERAPRRHLQRPSSMPHTGDRGQLFIRGKYRNV